MIINPYKVSAGGGASGFGAYRQVNLNRRPYVFNPTWIANCTGWYEAQNDQVNRAFVDRQTPSAWTAMGSQATNGDSFLGKYVWSIPNSTALGRPHLSAWDLGSYFDTTGGGGQGRINTNTSNFLTTTAYTFYSVFLSYSTGSAGGDALFNCKSVLAQGGTGDWGVALRNGNLELYHTSNVSAVSLPFNINTWYLLELYYDGTTAFMSLNGNASASAAVGTVTSLGGQTRIARCQSATLSGKLALLVMYNRTLTTDERRLSRYSWGRRYGLQVYA